MAVVLPVHRTPEHKLQLTPSHIGQLGNEYRAHRYACMTASVRRRANAAGASMWGCGARVWQGARTRREIMKNSASTALEFGGVRRQEQKREWALSDAWLAQTPTTDLCKLCSLSVKTMA